MAKLNRGSAVLDLRVRTTWKHGPAAGARGPLLVSYTEFAPHTMRDVPGVYLAAERLREACTKLEGAVGVTTYWQPFRRRGGSLSVWTDAAALRSFVSLPYHVEIMRRYRTRGTVRSVDWQTGAFELATAFEVGQGALHPAVDQLSYWRMVKAALCCDPAARPGGLVGRRR